MSPAREDSGSGGREAGRFMRAVPFPYKIDVAQNLSQALITRLPYAASHDSKVIFEQCKKVDLRGLICLSIPIFVEAPNSGGKLITELEAMGLVLVAKIAWYRDRHIVCSRSRRLTNTWEEIAIFSRSKNYIFDRASVTKIKAHYANKTDSFTEEEFLTCVGDHWGVPNDRRDRRYLPEQIVLNCANLAQLQPDDTVLDPYGNPGVQDACDHYGWTYKDGLLPSELRTTRKAPKKEPGLKSV